MKFQKGDELTWHAFLEACHEVDEKAKKHLNAAMQMPQSFSSIEDAEQYFRSLGGITIEEFEQEMRKMYGL